MRYNKLVRDKIPEIITLNGEIAITKVLSDTEYKKAMEAKLFEEYKEVIEANGTDRLEELADMLEIIRSLAKMENASLEDVIKIADIKKEKRGGFEKRIYLERVIKK